MVAPRVSRVLRAAAAALVVCAAAVVTGCGDDVDGHVAVVGSVTTLPYVSNVAGQFAAENPLVDVSLRMDGTASGMTVFCDGAAQIAGASRPINDNEILACKQAGVNYVQLMVAKDAIVAFTGPLNTRVTCLSLADLYALTSTEALGDATWKSATALSRSLGSRTVLPQRALLVVTPNAASGTRQLFLERVIAPFAERRHQRTDLRADHRDVDWEAQMLAEADVAPGLLGIAGYATVNPWGKKVRVLSLRRARGCVAPTAADIASGAYPLARPLYLYVNIGAAKGSEAVRALTDALVDSRALSSAGDGAAVPLSASDMQATQNAWAAALAGEPTPGT